MYVCMYIDATHFHTITYTNAKNTQIHTHTHTFACEYAV